MPIGWMTVLQSVPWADVIRNAPKVAEGARKLWNTVGKNAPVPEVAAPGGALTPEAQAYTRVERRAAALEAEVATLREQMVATSELIQALAEQNTQLIQRVEANRVRVAWLSAAAALAALTAVAALALAWMQLV
jgi:coenzyme F420-reducing hydrogenase alpha subunit